MIYKCRKLPVCVEAIRFTGEPSNAREIAEFIGHDSGNIQDRPVHSWDIVTPEGTMRCSPGDWIIKGTKGEFYPCRGDVFVDVYQILHEVK